MGPSFGQQKMMCGDAERTFNTSKQLAGFESAVLETIFSGESSSIFMFVPGPEGTASGSLSTATGVSFLLKMTFDLCFLERVSSNLSNGRPVLFIAMASSIVDAFSRFWPRTRESCFRRACASSCELTRFSRAHRLQSLMVNKL